MALLWLLATHSNRVFSRDELMQLIWPGLVVGEDTLARAVFKLRKALNDDAKAPRYVDTLPKLGYRFICPINQSTSSIHLIAPLTDPTSAPPMPIANVHPQADVRLRRSRFAAGFTAIGLIAMLTWYLSPTLIRSPAEVGRVAANVGLMTQRGNDYYAQYSQHDNQAAIELYERVIAMQPQHAPAYAGLANALIQTVIRWHDDPARDNKQAYSRLRDALQRGLTKTPWAQASIERAMLMANRAVELAPRSAGSYKALGFVLSAKHDFHGALVAYERSLALDPDAWGAMINIADLLDATGHNRDALQYLEAAFAAMTRSYQAQYAQIQPWYAEIAGLIGERHQILKQLDQAELWYRRTLQIAPFEPKASAKLATLLRLSGREAEAQDVCARSLRAAASASKAPCSV